MTEPDNAVITLGEIVGVFGVKGWVKLFSYTEPKEKIGQYAPWLVGNGVKSQSVVLEVLHIHGKGLIAKLQDINDRDSAALLIGHSITVARSELAALPANEFYWRDLLGLRVVNLQGIELGDVEQLLETGAHDVLVIKKEGMETLIPYVWNHFIYAVNLEAGIIQVDWPVDWQTD
ncbi:MAG: ribosome maturation factor RimM [Gammaproteobacteria bacterium]|nr:ribosome maturation factor RimM [Gammaproteobacteria bacterium]